MTRAMLLKESKMQLARRGATIVEEERTRKGEGSLLLLALKMITEPTQIVFLAISIPRRLQGHQDHLFPV